MLLEAEHTHNEGSAVLSANGKFPLEFSYTFDIGTRTVVYTTLALPDALCEFHCNRNTDISCIYKTHSFMEAIDPKSFAQPEDIVDFATYLR